MELQREAKRPNTTIERIREIKETVNAIKEEIRKMNSNVERESESTFIDDLWEVEKLTISHRFWDESKENFAKNIINHIDILALLRKSPGAIKIILDNHEALDSPLIVNNSSFFITLGELHKLPKNKKELYEKVEPVVICTEDDMDYTSFLSNQKPPVQFGRENLELKVSYIVEYAYKKGMYMPGADYLLWLNKKQRRTWWEVLRGENNLTTLGTIFIQIDQGEIIDAALYSLEDSYGICTRTFTQTSDAIDSGGVILLPMDKYKK